MWPKSTRFGAARGDRAEIISPISTSVGQFPGLTGCAVGYQLLLLLVIASGPLSDRLVVSERDVSGVDEEGAAGHE